MFWNRDQILPKETRAEIMQEYYNVCNLTI